MPDLSRLKWYAVLAIGVVFTLGGAGMIVTGAQHGWAVFLFFGLCAAVSINELWPGLLARRSTPPDVLLQQFPGPVELRIDKRKFLFALIGAAIFGGVALWALYNEPFGWFATVVLWLGVIGCAAAVPLMIVLMFRGASLRLDAEGLQVRHALRSHQTLWADASEFDVAILPTSDTKMVVFDDARSSASTLAAISAGMIGRSGGLPDSYGMSHEELAWLLNAWRARALAAGSSKRT